jgi:hypothetical protein
MLQVSEAFDVSRAISHGWAGVKRQPVGLLLGSLLLTLTEGGGGGGNPMGGKYDWGDGSSSSDHKSIAMPADLWSEKIRGAIGDVFDVHTAAGIAAIVVALTCASAVRRRRSCCSAAGSRPATCGRIAIS